MTPLAALLKRIAGERTSPARETDPSLHATLAERVVSDLSDRLQQRCQLAGVHATRTGSLIVRVNAERAYIAKLALRASTEPRLRHSAQALTALAQANWMTPFLSSCCPGIAVLGSVAGHFYSVESVIPGQDGASLVKAGGNTKAMIESAERFLFHLQRASMSVLTPARWIKPFESAISRVRDLAKRAEMERPYDRLIADLRWRLSAQRLPAVYSHGNFWLGNALFDHDGMLTGVIDWDCADEHSLPAIDLIYLAVRTHSLERSASFGEGFVDWINAPSLPSLDRCVANHFRDLSISTAFVVPLAYCSWIQHLDAHCRFGTTRNSDTRWLERNVRRVLEQWRQRPTASADGRRWAAGGAHRTDGLGGSHQVRQEAD